MIKVESSINENKNDILLNENIINGTPILNKDFWRGNNDENEEKVHLISEDTDINLQIINNMICLDIGNEVEIKKYYNIKNVYCGVNKKDEFCRIMVNNLSEENMKLFKAALPDH